ncbi:MAG TPA: AAA family ATPase [Acidimicrobiia bacterium]|nr:AAA family ATPase [Acidimicrobiia bacterium]HEV3452343.1 AAA family ATPase [Acidimicrobiia bacterium]
MFLKSLTLKGFKSFADTTSLDFEPGVTVVVGPNGSGKSNLVDAVAWVLGAQGPRTLRGARMEDVIFAGTPSRPPLGRAEVSLTIDNTARLLPIEFSEVTITRSLFRTGESEYELNGVPCRLLDLQELLSDTGIGRQQHVIVGQGQLDTILSATPEDRRAIVEEAAGILKFRRRKERAERRLAATEGNLVRLQDLLREVRRQLAPLQRQAEAAQRHGDVVAELRAIRLYLVGHQLAGFQTRLARLHDEREGLAARDRELHDRLAALDEDVIDAEHSLTALGVEGLAEWVARAEALRERGRGLGALLAEKRRGLERELAAAADAGVVETLVADAVALRGELAALDAGELVLPDTDALVAVETADDTLRAAEERWRAAEVEAARARAGAESLERQRRVARAEAAAGELEPLDGVLGPLVDHLEIDDGAEAAVGSALGDAMRAVVVRGAAARPAMARLHAGETGALLVVLGDRADPPSLDLPTGARPLGDAVRARDDELQRALTRLLAGHVLVDDWRAALDVVAERPELVAVTADGDRIGGQGTWSVGGGHAPAITPRALHEAQERATTAEVARAEAERTVEAARATLGAARAAELRRAAAEERRAVLGARLADVEGRLAARDPEAQATAERQRRALLDRDESLGGVARRLAEHRARADALAERLRDRRRRETEAARVSAEQLDRLRGERRALEQELTGVRERLGRVDVDDAEARLRLDATVESLRSQFDVEPHVALDAPAPTVPEGTTLAGRARELERDLRLMGPINPLALEEHRSLQARHEFLESQLEDVRASRRELNRVLRAVDREIVRVFEQAFADVSTHFTNLFATLFPGGAGRLTLIDPDDLLNTGIEVDARPSGKTVRRLSLLSGGERSLTALAYLFAVFRARPSPFYLLDEVEAALDDVNLHRFLDLVHEFRNEAQLVIVTHQKRTMEAADILYGVTMPPGGSTRVVSERVADPVGA